MPHLGFLEWLSAAEQMSENPLVLGFLFFVMADIVTGYAKSWFTGKINSSIGRKGLIKHSTVIFCVILFYPWFDILNLDAFGISILTAWLIDYILSVVENLGVLGLRLPKWITSRLAKLNSDLDEKPIDFKKGDDKNDRT